MTTVKPTKPINPKAVPIIHSSPAEARRKAAIKAVKACQRQLGIDDDTYRAMLQARTGHASATLCSVEQLGVVLDHFKRNGAVNPKGEKGLHADGRKRQVPVADRAALMRKVAALLLELARVTGVVHTLAYADAICVRSHWCTRVDFASPQVLHSLVGALSRTLRSKQQAAEKAAQKGNCTA
jgi:phage gp16-like protein